MRVAFPDTPGANRLEATLPSLVFVETNEISNLFSSSVSPSFKITAHFAICISPFARTPCFKPRICFSYVIYQSNYQKYNRYNINYSFEIHLYISPIFKQHFVFYISP